jgi:hypothetical protein
MRRPKVPMCESLAVATKVLNLVRLPKLVKTSDVRVEVFDNCREQGYAIIFSGFRIRKDDKKGVNHDAYIYFSRNRNSDDIVVYHDDERGGIANMPSEVGWKNRILFRHNQTRLAVKHIENLLGQAAVVLDSMVTPCKTT